MRWFSEDEYRSLQRENSILEAMIKALQEENEALKVQNQVLADAINKVEEGHKKGKGKK